MKKRIILLTARSGTIIATIDGKRNNENKKITSLQVSANSGMDMFE